MRIYRAVTMSHLLLVGVETTTEWSNYLYKRTVFPTFLCNTGRHSWHFVLKVPLTPTI